MKTSDMSALLAYIRAFHQPFDSESDAVLLAWTDGFADYPAITLEEAMAAVRAFFTDPAFKDPWIKPGHVVGRVREARQARLRDVDLGALAAGLDADDPEYVRKLRARRDAIASGQELPRAIEGRPR